LELEWTLVYGGPDWTRVDWSGPGIRIDSGLGPGQECTIQSGLEWASGLECTVNWSVDCSGPQTIKSGLKWTSELMWTKDWSVL